MEYSPISPESTADAGYGESAGHDDDAVRWRDLADAALGKVKGIQATLEQLERTWAPPAGGEALVEPPDMRIDAAEFLPALAGIVTALAPVVTQVIGAVAQRQAAPQRPPAPARPRGQAAPAMPQRIPGPSPMPAPVPAPSTAPAGPGLPANLAPLLTQITQLLPVFQALAAQGVPALPSPQPRVPDPAPPLPVPGPAAAGGAAPAAGPALESAAMEPFESAPDYPPASRFAEAKFFRRPAVPRSVRRIVIHITDGGPDINGTARWFANPWNPRTSRWVEVSSHYIVGQDGEVVQAVREADIVFHAGSANADSIGIEHVARQPRALGSGDPGLAPSSALYCASAALVSHLCEKYGIPVDRQHILGHSEADPRTTHRACPDSVWDWAHFMELVRTRTCLPAGAARETAYEFPEWA